MSEQLNVLKDIINLIKSTKGELDGVKTSIVEISKAARETQKSFDFKTPKTVSTQLQKNTQYTEQLTAAQKEQDRLEKALIRQIAKKDAVLESTNRALIKQRYETQQLNKLAKEEAVLTSKVSSFYQKQNVILNRLTRRRQDLLLKQKLGFDLTRKETKELQKLTSAQTKLSKAFKESDAQVGRNFRNVGNYKSALAGLKNIAGGLIAGFGVVEGLRMSFNFAKEARELAIQAKGVEFAFERLGKRGVEAFDNIKKSTRGTISDLDIKTALVDFDNFNISLEETDTLFEFLAVRAAQTGKSVEELQSSLVEGLSKESKLRIDNLGISTAELNAELEKTPNFVEAVANIAKREITEAGDILDSAANSQAKWNADLKNFKLLVGNDVVASFSDAMYTLGSNVLRLITPTKTLVTEIQKEQTELNLLVNQITDVNIENEKREELIGKLRAQYPSFLKFLDQEKTDNESLSSALDEVNQLYIKRIALQTQQEAIQELLDKSGRETYKLATSQIKVDRELAKINSGILKSGLELTNTTYQERIDKVTKALEADAKFTTNQKTGVRVALNEEAKALQKLDQLLGKTTSTKIRQTRVNSELTEQQKLMAELEENLGFTMEEINKILENNTAEKEKNKDADEEIVKSREKLVTVFDQLKTSAEQLKREIGKMFVEGKIDAVEYEKRLSEVDQAIEDITEGLKAVKNLPNPLESITTPSNQEALNYLKGELAEIEEQMKNFGETGELSFEQIFDKGMQIFGQLGDLASVFFDRNIQKIDDQINKNDEYYSNILDNEELTLKQRAAIEAEQERKRLELEKKKREEQRKQAIVAKAFNATMVIASTAKAVIAALEPPPVGLGPVAGVPLAAATGIFGAAQLATILAQPIPQFREGHLEGTHEGIAMINDAPGTKFREIVERKDGSLQMYGGRNQLIGMEKGDKVHKAGTFTPNDIIRQSIAMTVIDQQQRLNQAQQEQILNINISDQVSKMFSREFSKLAPHKPKEINYSKLAQAINLENRVRNR